MSSVHASTSTVRALVHLDDVWCTYGKGPRAVVAVHSASASVFPADKLAIVGASGSGKSTLLHLMAGLLLPTAGRVTWPGLQRAPTRRPGLVGTIFQGPSLLPALNVLENVELPLLLQGRDAASANQDAADALTTLGLDGFGSALPEELSGGQAQRVAVARVLALRPVLICADEPTGQLDRDNADHVVDVLLRAGDELGAAVVIATHDPRVSARLRNRWSVVDGDLRTGADLRRVST